MRVLPLCLLGLLGFFTLRATAATATTWSPSSAALDAAYDYSRAHNGLSLLVIQHGRVLMERYAEGNGPDVPHKIYSGTKGFFCVAAVAAQADGLIDLDEPAADVLTEWRGQPGRDRITIRELLNFTAGIDPGFHLHSDDVTDRDRYALSLPEVAQPGESFIYGPSQIQLFCEILRRRLASRAGGETPWHYVERRVLKPLGLGDPPHKIDAEGIPLCAAGMQLTAREWARFGYFLLNGGHSIVAQRAFATCLEGTRMNPAFGMGFWLNDQAAEGRAVNVEDMLEPKWYQEDWHQACLCPSAPSDLFVSLGSMGQRLYVIPSLGMIVVRLSNDSHYSDAEFLSLLVGKYAN
jgi:CubicO group peptidase (beta-lactamase class C family)